MKVPVSLRERAGGLIELRRARSTGTEVALVLASYVQRTDEHAPEAYLTICQTHGGLVGHASLKAARQWLSHPEDWCPQCQEHTPR